MSLSSQSVLVHVETTPAGCDHVNGSFIFHSVLFYFFLFCSGLFFSFLFFYFLFFSFLFFSFVFFSFLFFYFILFYFILFYFMFFSFILFYFILLYFMLFFSFLFCYRMYVNLQVRIHPPFLPYMSVNGWIGGGWVCGCMAVDMGVLCTDGCMGGYMDNNVSISVVCKL